MRRDEIERLLPTMYQLAARPGSPLDALLHVMADLHEPDEQLLANVDSLFDPYRAPAPLVPWLTRWVGLEWLVADEDGEMDPADQVRAFGPGLGRLRDVLAAGHAAAQWRGTEVGLTLLLTAATGITGFGVAEPADRPFHLVVTAPARARPHAATVRRIVETTKPAACTAEVSFAPPATDRPPVPGDDHEEDR